MDFVESAQARHERQIAERRARTVALHAAARVGDHARLIALVTDGADLEDTLDLALGRDQRRAVTALMVAAGSGQGATVDTVRLLVELGAEPEREVDGRSALSYAAGGLDDEAPGGGDAARLGFFLQRGRIDELSRRELELLTEAIATGDAARVGLLLEHGLYPDAPPTQVMPVIERDGWRMVDDLERVPLVHAARRASVAVVERLLAAGADPRIIDGQRRHALFVVREPAVARALVAAGLAPDLPGRGELTPLADAIDRGDRARVEALLAVGANPGAVVDGRTLLMRSVSRIDDRDPAILRLLVEHGADPHAVTVHGWNALDCAVDHMGWEPPSTTAAVLGYLVELGVADLGKNNYMSAREHALITEARGGARRPDRAARLAERPRVRPAR